MVPGHKLLAKALHITQPMLPPSLFNGPNLLFDLILVLRLHLEYGLGCPLETPAEQDQLKAPLTPLCVPVPAWPLLFTVTVYSLAFTVSRTTACNHSVCGIDGNDKAVFAYQWRPVLQWQ